MRKTSEQIKHLNVLLSLLPHLWGNSWQIRTRLILSFIFIILTIILNISVPLLLRHIVSTISMATVVFSTAFISILLGYGFIWIFSKVMENLRQIVAYRALERCAKEYSLKFFGHLISLPYHFHVNKKMGTITNAVDRAQAAIPTVFWSMLFVVIPTMIEIIIAASVLWYFYGLKYGFILFFICISFIFYTLKAMPWAVAAQRKSNIDNQEVSAFLVDRLMNIETIQASATIQDEIKECNRRLDAREDSMTKQSVRMDIVLIGQSLIIGLGLTFLTILAGFMVTHNQNWHVSDFILINSYLLQFITPLGAFGFVFRQMHQGLTDIENSLEILNIQFSKIESADMPIFKPYEGKIEFINVCFGYDPLYPTIRSFSLKINPGSVVAIVGSTGSGKSTLAKLLVRFYEPISGKILIDDQDITSVKLDSLRLKISLVSQEPMLFNTSIYENIIYGNANVSTADVDEAIKIAMLDSVIKAMPQGYHTLVGERGLRISGGEKQRIAIARAVLKKPLIYIYDESTSALDAKTERIIQKNLRNYCPNATTIIIAHRLSAITDVDEIIVLQEGTIIERGKHKDLLNNNGFYADLWNKQVKKELRKNETFIADVNY